MGLNIKFFIMGEKNSKLFRLFIFTLVIITVQIKAQNGWTKKTNMPISRAMPCAIALNNQIYVLGGGDAALNDYNNNQLYDPSTDS